MEHLLFAGYLVLFTWLVTRLPGFRSSGLTKTQLAILFLLKVVAGIFYGWIGIYHGNLAKMTDTWAFHYQSLNEAAILRSNPMEFFGELLRPRYGGYGGFFDTEHSWWNDFKENGFLKLLAFFQLLSFGNYYINVIFYSFLTLGGCLLFYRTVRAAFPAHQMPVMAGAFLIPSFLYWTSGLHKDGLLFAGIAWTVYHAYQWIHKGQREGWRVAAILLGLVAVLLLRHLVVLVLLPPLCVWALAAQFPHRAWTCFVASFVVIGSLFFLLPYLHPALDIPAVIANRQAAFYLLDGESFVEMPRLKPTAASFLRGLPYALANTILRPHPGDIRHLLSLAGAIETMALLILLPLPFLYPLRSAAPTAFRAFLLFFSLSLLIMIGYTVPFLGAIARYRSVVLPFAFVPVIAGTDWKRIHRKITDILK